MVYNRISKMIESNHAQGKYEHADTDNEDNVARPRKGLRDRKRPEFFHDEAKETKVKSTKRKVKRKLKKKHARKRMVESDEESYDGINRNISSKRSNIFEDSSDESVTEIAEKNRSVMKRRKQNFESAEMIDNDIQLLEGSRRPGIHLNRQYRSIRDGGNDFCLREEMKRSDACDDETDSFKDIQDKFQATFDNQQIERRNELIKACILDRKSMNNESLFDAELSDDEDDSKPSVTVGNVSVHGNNNSISLNVIQQPQRDQRTLYGMMTQPMYYDGYQTYRHGFNQRQLPSCYDRIPRFYMNQHYTAPMITQSTESAIRSKLASLDLSSRDCSWVEQLLEIARKFDDGSLTIQEKDWIFNQRRRSCSFEGWKRDILEEFRSLARMR